LGKPRAVTPRIVDPNRPRLDVAFVAATRPVDMDEPPEVPPSLTQDEAPPPRTPARPPTTDERAVAAHLQQAREALTSGALDQAITALSDVLDIQPGHLDARLTRGRCWSEQGQYSAALSDFRRAEDVAPLSAAPAFEMANLYFGKKAYEQAIHLYSQAINQDPEHAMAHCRRGMSHHFRGQTSQAQSDLQTAMQLDPDIPNIQRYLRMAGRGLRGR